MDTMDFIQQLSAGNASDAKDTLNTIISGKAFDALDSKKQELAQTLFNTEESFDVDNSGKEPSDKQKKESDELKTKSKDNTKALNKISKSFSSQNK